jgi:hypothetical protein
MARPKSGEGVSRLIVASEDMMKFKAVELLLEFPYLLAVYRHAGVAIIRLPHDLIDDELRVLMDVEPLDPDLDSDAQTIDEGLKFCHIVGFPKM